MKNLTLRISIFIGLLALFSQCQGLSPMQNIGGGAQDSTIDEVESGYDTEGLASLPVTPPKADSGDINALNISFEVVDASISKTYSFFQSAHALSAGQKLIMVGQENTVSESAEMLLEIETDSLEFEAQENGSFRVEIPENFIEEVMTLKYKNLDEGVEGTELGLVVDDTGRHYIVTLGNESSGIHENSLTTYETEVFYNTFDGVGNLIKRRDITGGQSEAFLNTSGPLSVMDYYPSRDFDALEMIIGINPDLDVVKVNDNGQFNLNDFQNGDTLPNGSVLKLQDATQVSYKNGRLAAYFGSEALTDKVSPLTLVPINEDNSDFIIKNDKMKFAISRHAEWIDLDHLLTFTRYRHPTSNAEDARRNGVKEFKDLARPDSEADMIEYTVVQIYDFSQFGQMSFAEMQAFSDRMGPVIPSDPTVVFATRSRMQRPNVTHVRHNKTAAYYMFRYEDPDTRKEQIGIGNYSQKAKILTSTYVRKNVISVSLYGDFVAYDTISATGEASVRLLHLPTLTEAELFKQEDLKPGERLLNPKFSDQFPYALTYVVGSTEGNAKVGVINLANHPWAKALIQASDVQNGFTLDHIFNNESLPNVPTIPVP